MGLAGAGAGAAKALEEILGEQMQRALLAQRQKEHAEQIAVQQQRADQDAIEGNARIAQGQQQIDMQAGDRRQRTNIAGVRRMLGEAITQRTGPITSDDRRGMAALQVEAGDDPTLLNEPAPKRDPVADHEAFAKIDAKYRQPTRTPEEPLVAIMGPDGVPVLVRRSQAEGKRPASTREQGRPVMVSSAKDLSDIDEAIKLANQLDFKPDDTGIMPSIGGAMPDAVTSMTGFGLEAKKRQGVINLVKQIIGKGLEGGVLRKEDESKYEKILPTLSDHPDVVTAKIANLKNTMGMKRSTLLDSLSDAGFDTSRFIERGEPKPQDHNAAAGTFPEGTMQKPIPNMPGAIAESRDGGKTWKRVK